jgi:hypothetical protein
MEQAASQELEGEDVSPDAADEADATLDAGVTAHLAELPLVTSDAELSFAEALALTGRRGVRLVMPMGEIGVGKTTIMVELWTQLAGVQAIDGYRCAGSRTAMAFEERAYLSRMAAGVGRRSTARTHYNENEGLLHLEVARPDGALIDLLFADYSGERYEKIREGASARDELAWAPRADRMLLVVNGRKLQKSNTREIETDRAARLLYALRTAGLVRRGARVAVVVAREDEVDESAFASSQPRLDALVGTAKELDEGAVLLRIAARPKSGDPPAGFGALLDWICSDDPPVAPATIDLPVGTRAISRFRQTL